MKDEQKKHSEFFNLNAKEIEELLKEKAYKHTNYYHYTHNEAVDSILKDEKIWISSMLYSNDTTEKTACEENTYKMFQLCFATGISENLPLWFLYSGINGYGARLGWKQADIKDWIKPENMELWLWKKSDKSMTKLICGKNCEIKFQDILYLRREGRQYRIKHNNVQDNIPLEVIEEYKKNNPTFYKGLIWFYEKETRLTVEITDLSLINKEEIEKEKDSYRIELKIPVNVYKNTSIMFSPKYKNTEEIEKESQKAGIKKLNAIKNKSEYAGEINIDLCRKCNQKCVSENCKTRKIEA